VSDELQSHVFLSFYIENCCCQIFGGYMVRRIFAVLFFPVLCIVWMIGWVMYSQGLKKQAAEPKNFNRQHRSLRQRKLYNKSN
jgi:hypothetical protein